MENEKPKISKTVLERIKQMIKIIVKNNKD